MDKWLCLTTASSGAAAVSEGGGMDFTAVFLIISIIVAVVLPVSLLIYGKVKGKGSFIMTIWGMVGYIVPFASLLPALTG